VSLVLTHNDSRYFWAHNMSRKERESFLRSLLRINSPAKATTTYYVVVAFAGLLVFFGVGVHAFR